MSHLNVYALIFSLIISIVSAKVEIISYGRCKSSYIDSDGHCIALANCPHLLRLLSSNMSAADQYLLKSTQCGYDGTANEKTRQVLVCCPNQTSIPTEVEAAISTNLFPEPGECGRMMSTYIYGGNETSIDDYPWMALIMYKHSLSGEVKPGCSASLINSRYVITAAHCVNNSEKNDDWKIHQIRLGEWDTNKDPDCVTTSGGKECAPPKIDAFISTIIKHPMYDNSPTKHFYDIALIKMAKSVAFNAYVKPICLPLQTETYNYTGTAMRTAGWGLTEFGHASNVKLQIMIWGVETSECQETYQHNRVISSTHHLCVKGAPGADTCLGDSGGPLMRTEHVNNLNTYFLAGTLAFGATPCAQPNWPSVYIRISSHMEWIKQTLTQLAH